MSSTALRAPLGYGRCAGRDHRDQLAELLRDLQAGGSFATRRITPCGDLDIDVRGVGSLRLPVSAVQGKELRLVARPAKYGHGADTVLDRRIRDTWEVPKSRVRIDKRRWNQTLAPMLDVIRGDLGLPDTTRLRAELHSMLVYEPDQFFAGHQDSEKSDDMIGSLIVMLPSTSTGGDLLVEHRGRSERYQGSASSLVFVAFYSDTRHEVLPVERGYRVALTYNLMLTGDTATVRSDPDLAAAASALLEQHFSQSPEPRWRGDRLAGEPPDRLVFLLDHHYTERGLAWAHLKGIDAARAAVIAEAAELAGCDLGLAHAQIQETWECYDDTPGLGRRRRYWDDGPESGGDGLELGDLLDSSVAVTAAAGTAVAFDAHVSSAELVAATPSVELTPHDTEYTGYMGNWGNTMDRWYQRAAIVVWPRTRAFALQAKADPVAAAYQILATIDTTPDDAAGMVTTLLRFWPDSARRLDQRTLLPTTLRLAWELADHEHATALLEPFGIEALASRDATVVLALTEHHGLDWLDHQITTWFRNRSRHTTGTTPERAAWVADLPELIAALHDDPHAAESTRVPVVRTLIAHAWAWLDTALTQAAAVPTPSRRDAMLTDLAEPVLGVLRATAIANTDDLRSHAVEALSRPNTCLEPVLANVIAAAGDLSPDDLRDAGITTLARTLAEAITRDLAEPERAPGDWSIPRFDDSTCCGDCARLASFLHDPTEQQLTWPLAKPRRQHIHHRIDEAELPVTHQTLRQGSPQKLVVTKTDELFRHDAQQRRTARARLDIALRVLETTR